MHREDLRDLVERSWYWAKKVFSYIGKKLKILKKEIKMSKFFQDWDVKLFLVCIGMCIIYFLITAFNRAVSTGVLAAVVIAVSIGCFYYLVIVFAQIEIFFCWAQENEPRPIMHVGRKGEFKKFVMSSHTRCFLNNWDIVLLKDVKEGKYPKKNVYKECWGSRLFACIGLKGYKWMGILSRPYIYEFAWAKYKIVKGESVLAEKGPEKISWIYSKEYIYAGEVNDAEVKAPAPQQNSTEAKRVTPVNVKAGYPITIVNPHKALFEVEHWLDATLARIEPYIRWHLQSKTYEEANEERYLSEVLLDTPTEQLPDDLRQQVASVVNGKGVILFLKEKYGVSLAPVEMKQIKFTNPADKKLYELTYVEQQKADGAVIKAKGEAASIELVAEAKNKDRQLAIDQGSAGVGLFKAQVMQKIGEQGNLIVSNSPVSLFANENRRKIDSQQIVEEKEELDEHQ